MRLSAWFAVVRCYGLDGYHYASHLTIAQESGQLNIQMSPKRAHFEKKIGLYILGYNGEFRNDVKREVEKIFNKLKKGEKKMTEENNSQEVQTTNAKIENSESTTIQILNIFQEKIDRVQDIIDDMEYELGELDVSIEKTEAEIESTQKTLENLQNQLKFQSTRKDGINGVLEYLKLTKEGFENIK